MEQRRNIFRTLVMLCMLPLTIAGCTEGSDIGDLYGRWKLQSIEGCMGTIAQPDTIFLSFQGDVYQYQPNWQYDWGTYQLTDTTLTLNPLAYMSAFGFRDLMHNLAYDGQHPITFRLNQLTDQNMQLQRHDTI